MKKSIILLLSALAFNVSSALPQEDSRGRNAATIVADALAQLPAQKQKSYDNVMAELATTGAAGVVQLAEMLVPADKGENAKIEYALNGLVSYVTSPGKTDDRNAVREGLRKSIEKITDNANKAFLMSLLQRCSTTDDAPFFARYVSDPYLADWAMNGLIATPGSENEVLRLISEDKVQRTLLANAAAAMRLKQAEPTLMKWTAEAGENDIRACYMALAATGSSKSLSVLAKAAKECDYAWCPSGATEAYVSLIENLSTTPGEEKAALDAAKKLISSTDRTNVRGAALNVIFNINGKKAAPMLVKAMGDKDRAYRVNALRRAQPWADDDVCASLGKIATSNKNPQVKTDILNWFGANKTESQTDAVIANLNDKNSEVKTAAIKAAGRIGGDRSLEALVAKLGSDVSDKAESALLAFNGKVNGGIMKALDGDKKMQIPALRIAAARKMTAASPKVFQLIESEDADLQTAAYKALAGVVTADDFATLCALIEKNATDCRSELTDALRSSIARETPATRYDKLMKQISTSKVPANYYAALAENASQSAVTELLRRYDNGIDKNAALDALLSADTPEMIGILHRIAENAPESRTRALTRYAALVSKAQLTPVRKYQLYRKGIELTDDAVVRKLMLKGLGSTATPQALFTSAQFLDDREVAPAAAAAVRTIVSKNSGSIGGKNVKAALEKAREVYKRGTTADDGYAVDDINGLLSKLEDNGFENTDTYAAEKLSFEKQAENFEMMFEWTGNGKLSVRSTPVASLGTLADTLLTCREALAQNDHWNSTYIKVVNDRLTLINNGITIADNKTMVNSNDRDIPVPSSGLTCFTPSDGSFKVRDVYVRELPSTPLFTLSPEEEAEGFKNLFDGRSMHHWTGNTTDYVPVDGNIYVTAAYGNGGNLYTVDQYGDFVLRFEFCFEREGVNNGVGIRTPMGVDAAYHGMEIQILDHDAPIYRKLREYQVHGSVYGVIPAKRIKHPKLGEWSTEEIRAVGDRITVTVNGEVILDGDIRLACQGNHVAPDGSNKNPYTVDKKNHPGLFNKKGHIGFLGHGAGVKFRNIRVKSLD